MSKINYPCIRLSTPPELLPGTDELLSRVKGHFSRHPLPDGCYVQVQELGGSVTVDIYSLDGPDRMTVIAEEVRERFPQFDSI